MFRKVYGLLLISILVMCCMGCVSAKDYNSYYYYNVGDNFTGLDVLNDINSTRPFSMNINDVNNFIRDSTLFIPTGTYIHLINNSGVFVDYFWQAAEVGKYSRKINYGWVWDSYYLNFVVGPRSV